MSSSSTQLFGRKAQLIVTPNNTNSANPTSATVQAPSAPFTFSTAVPLPALDLSQFHFKFDIRYSDVPTPNTAIFRVYNLGQRTIDTIIKEYTEVVLTAGYDNVQYGTIFQGNITQFRRGKEDNVDSFLEIQAADGDVPYNFGFVNFSLPAGSTPAQQLAAAAASSGLKVDPQATALLNATGGVMPRGIVALGLMRSQLNMIAKSAQARWSIQNGMIVLIPLTGYLPGEAVVLNSTSGMVGVPETTDQGVRVRSLLNPKIQIGQRVQINEKDITTDYITKQYYKNGANAENKDGAFTANVVADGIYRVMTMDHSGDTRDVPWYTDLICLAIDPTAASNITNPNGTLGTVKAYGG